VAAVGEIISSTQKGTDLHIVAIIPARGGSKGIPGKNVVDLCGKPLLAWSILQAKDAKSVSQVYVSSDDDDILKIAASYGAYPIRRPAALASDTSSSESALLHVLDEIGRTGAADPDLVVFLQATSPLREPKDIDGAVSKIIAAQADSLFSAAVLEDFCVWKKTGEGFKGLTFDPFNRGMRQEREPLFLENGSIYLFRPEVLRRGGNRLGGEIAIFEMPYWKSLEIDTPEDLDIINYYFKQKLLPNWDAGKTKATISTGSIDLIAYDFDGVMTDNRVLVLQDGTEGIVANRADGLGVDRLRALNIPQLIVTTETNAVVQARAGKLRLEVIGACKDKKAALEAYCTQHGYALARVMFVGNDLNDLEVMKIVGLPAAPADAHPEIKALARLITRAKGGDGVVKEISERIVA
jgi:YrbI family 3-deoxy-D-manno-octulosonate 8-phosphate phosphatase